MDVVLLSILGGVLAAIPAMGPSSAIAIHRILMGRERTGLAFAGGYIFAEGLGCLAAIWGIDFIFSAVPLAKPILAWTGIVLLLGVGLYFASNLDTGRWDLDGDERDPSTLVGQFAFGFGLTAFNPALIAGWTTALGVVLSTTGVELAAWQKWFVPLGIIIGETLWYVVLVGAARHFDDELDAPTIDWLIRAVGVVLIGTAIWTGISRVIG